MSLRRIYAVTVLSLKTMTRTGGLYGLMALLAIVIVGLPRAIRHDGTTEGAMRILIQYPLATVAAILALATLWTACALPAVETASGRLQLTWVKPTHPMELWLGQWSAISVLNTVLLASALFAIIVSASLRIRPSDPSFFFMMRPTVRILPDGPPVMHEARRIFDEMRAAGALPSDESERDILRHIAHGLAVRHRPLHPGETISLPFVLPRPVASDETIRIRLSIRTPSGLPADLDGHLQLRDPASNRTASHPVRDVAHGITEFDLPLGALKGSRRLDFRFTYDAAPDAMTLLYRPRDGITLRLHHGSIAGNGLRAGFIVLSLLLLLAALGLSIGGMFSFPVAAFLTTGLLAACLAARFAVAERLPDPHGSPSVQMRMADAVVDGIVWSTTPLTGISPVESLATATWIDNTAIGRALIWRVMAYPTLLALLGAAALKRKEKAA